MKGEKPGDHPRDIAVYRGHGPGKSDAENGVGRVFSYPWKSQEGLPVLRKGASPSENDLLCRGMEVSGSGIVAQVLPEFQDLIRPRFRKGPYRWKSREKAEIIGDNRVHLSLLEHDLGNPDEIRLVGVPPREIPGMSGVPSEQS